MKQFEKAVVMAVSPLAWPLSANDVLDAYFGKSIEDCVETGNGRKPWKLTRYHPRTAPKQLLHGLK